MSAVEEPTAAAAATTEPTVGDKRKAGEDAPETGDKK